MTDTTRATNPRFAGGAVGTGGTDGTDVERALEAELERLMQIESFDPPPDFAAGALHDTSEYDRAAADPLAFWAEQARALDWEDTGQAIVAFVTLAGGRTGTDDTIEQLRDHVARRIGKLARPKQIFWSDDLPKTRSGKIMRRLLRDIAEGRELGDVTTLRDPEVMKQLKEKVELRPDAQ